MTDDCLFCKIAAGEVPSQEVLSTETTYAFRDIDPKAPTHVLVIPREHIADFDHIRLGNGPSAKGPVLADLVEVAQTVARNEGVSLDSGGNGYRIVFNVGDDAGNTVPHLHLHLIGGRKMAWPPG